MDADGRRLVNCAVGTVLWLVLATAVLAEPLEVKAAAFSATFSETGLSGLVDGSGAVFVRPGAFREGVAIHRVGGSHWARDMGAAPAPANVRSYGGFDGLEGASVACTFALDATSGDVVTTQEATSPEAGVWGVQWSIGWIPLDVSIIVPGRSGIKLTRTSPGSTHTFDYPLGWEAQLVIVEGAGRGFYVWAEDDEGRYKRLTVTRSNEGWRLGLTTINYAPFDDYTTCQSVKWRLNVYEGDWRVPARRYRDWAEAHFGPTRIEEQRPPWVKNIRCVVIMGMDIAMIEALTQRLDPRETLLYIPGWRKAGYDRDYPTYDKPFETLGPFIERAHALGYKVMLHTNYFGCDPLNPLYAQFEPYQVRSPWGQHDKQWWLWERADPVIKFAYINPAHKPWRELFVGRMVELCETYDVDALHPDQTLCIFNDHNGLMDGLSMIQGNILLHGELRQALPDVAISGEGLNEATYRYEAFAQRHAWGLNHADGTYDRTVLETAHPICAYLLGPYTRMYGYLGYAPPTSGQMYAAWNEAYEHWGIIPTLKPNRAQIDRPTGFSKQFFDEAAFWFAHHPEPDLEGPWPADVVFPFRTADGLRAVRTAEHALIWEKREISRTVTGVSEVALPGTIPGWRVYDRERLFGLDPQQWYPYSPEARDLGALHVEALPAGVVPTMVAERGDMLVVRTRHANTIVADFTELIFDATCTSEPFDGTPATVSGPLDALDGASFRPSGNTLTAHPPWKVAGSGIARARFRLHLPAEGTLRFTTEVAMEPAATRPGRTDGVTYGVTVVGGDESLHAECHNASKEPEELALDLTPFAGRDVTVDLTVHPGPDRNVSYDWARWYEPRIEREWTMQGELVVVGPGDLRLALCGEEPASLEVEGNRYRLDATFPGAVFLLRDMPKPVELPLDVAAAAFTTTFVSDTGLVLEAPLHAAAKAQPGAVGGTTRPGLFTHPPDHGKTVVDLPMTLPETPSEFHTFVGILDGSESTGVIFRVEANGVAVAERQVQPGAWHELTGDLTPWAGKPVVLSLIADADGSYICDWAQWGKPVVREETPGRFLE